MAFDGRQPSMEGNFFRSAMYRSCGHFWYYNAENHGILDGLHSDGCTTKGRTTHNHTINHRTKSAMVCTTCFYVCGSLILKGNGMTGHFLRCSSQLKKKSAKHKMTIYEVMTIDVMTYDIIKYDVKKYNIMTYMTYMVIKLWTDFRLFPKNWKESIIFLPSPSRLML